MRTSDAGLLVSVCRNAHIPAARESPRTCRCLAVVVHCWFANLLVTTDELPVSSQSSNSQPPSPFGLSSSESRCHAALAVRGPFMCCSMDGLSIDAPFSAHYQRILCVSDPSPSLHVPRGTVSLFMHPSPLSPADALRFWPFADGRIYGAMVQMTCGSVPQLLLHVLQRTYSPNRCTPLCSPLQMPCASGRPPMCGSTAPWCVASPSCCACPTPSRASRRWPGGACPRAPKFRSGRPSTARCAGNRLQ